MINDTFIKSMLIGSLLGDGSIESNGRKEYYTIGFTHHSTKESGYLKLKHDLLKRLYKVNDIKEAHNNTKRFRMSYTEKEIINEMIDLTRYEDNTRKIPDIDKLDDISILFWYLDDGSLSISKQKRPNGRKPSIHRKLRIALQSFRDDDILNFLDKFNNKFGLNFRPFREKIKGEDKIVAIGISNSIPEIIKFLDIINKYKHIIPEEMHYKFCLGYHETKLIKDDKLKSYNICNFHETGICDCRSKDLSECFK